MGNLAIKSSKPQTEQQKLEAIKKPKLNFQQFSEQADLSIQKSDGSEQKLGFESNLEIENPNSNSNPNLGNRNNILNKVVNIVNKTNENQSLNNMNDKVDEMSQLVFKHDRLLIELKEKQQKVTLDLEQQKINKKQDKATLEQMRKTKYLNSLPKK